MTTINIPIVLTISPSKPLRKDSYPLVESKTDKKMTTTNMQTSSLKVLPNFVLRAFYLFTAQ